MSYRTQFQDNMRMITFLYEISTGVENNIKYQIFNGKYTYEKSNI